MTFPGTVSIIKKSLPRVRGAFSKGNAMKKKTRIGILAAGVFVGVNYTLVSGKLVSRRAETIDLRGKNITAKQLTKAREKLPDAHILWDIAIGGKTFDGESENIVTADFTAGDIPAFEKTDKDSEKEADVLGKWVKTLPEPFNKEMSELYQEMEKQQKFQMQLKKLFKKLKRI